MLHLDLKPPLLHMRKQLSNQVRHLPRIRTLSDVRGGSYKTSKNINFNLNSF